MTNYYDKLLTWFTSKQTICLKLESLYMSNPTKTIIIDDAVPYAEAMFSHLGHVITLPGKSISAESVKNAHALIVRSRTQVNKTLLEGSSIEFVGSTVVGLDHIDQGYLTNNNIKFYSAQGCNANSVAEYIITMLFMLAEELSFDLSNKTLGIIGVGNVGSRLYKKAQILGIKCLLNDPPKLLKQPGLVETGPYVDLDQCLTADIITVHTPLTNSGDYPTQQLISAEKLQQIKDTQIIINAARGGIINEQAWSKTKTLVNIIDCWEDEPNIDEALYNSAYIATPHTAGHSLDAKVAGSSMVYERLCDFWEITPDLSWHNLLPKQPEAIQLDSAKTTQGLLADLFIQTHNIKNDDLAIRAKNITDVHNKYEYYRRNFPIYREWHQHKIQNCKNTKTRNTLISLGFNCLN